MTLQGARTLQYEVLSARFANEGIDRTRAAAGRSARMGPAWCVPVKCCSDSVGGVLPARATYEIGDRI